MSHPHPNKQVIKLMGDMKQNIKHLLLDLHCTCGFKEQIVKILTIYADKINKLRTQRNDLKDKYNSIKKDLERQRSEIAAKEFKNCEFDTVRQGNENFFEILYGSQKIIQEEGKKQPVAPVYQHYNEDQTLLIEDERENFEQNKVKEKCQGKQCLEKAKMPKANFNACHDKHTRNKQAKQKIKQDLQNLKCLRKPLGEKPSTQN